MKLNANPYKGTRDFYPKISVLNWSDEIHDFSKQDYQFSKIKGCLIRSGFIEYSSSLIESTEAFEIKSGGDLGGKELYNFVDYGERRIALRPELTLSVARMVANKFENLRYPLRWYTIGNCFRYERPQKGRSREFWQTEINIIGADSPYYDLEIIKLSQDLFAEFKARPEMFVTYYNHRGVLDEWVRANNWNIVKSELFKILDNWFKKTQEQTKLELEKILDGRSVERILQVCNNDGDGWKEYLEICKKYPEINLIQEFIPLVYPENKVILSPCIIRGQAYYTGLIFECFDTNPDNRRSLFGGGRFDDLLDIYGKKIQAVGFAPGDVSFHEFLVDWNLYPEKLNDDIIMVGIIPENEESVKKAFVELIPNLKIAGKSWQFDYDFQRSQNKRKESMQKRGCNELIYI
jgi:histidyl-tRNA synthetase